MNAFLDQADIDVQAFFSWTQPKFKYTLMFKHTADEHILRSSIDVQAFFSWTVLDQADIDVQVFLSWTQS